MASYAQQLFDEGLQKGKLEGLHEGLHEGLQKGLHEGLQKGKAERNKEIVLNLLKSKAPIELIVNATGLSAKEIQKLKEK